MFIRGEEILSGAQRIHGNWTFFVLS